MSTKSKAPRLTCAGQVALLFVFSLLLIGGLVAAATFLYGGVGEGVSRIVGGGEATEPPARTSSDLPSAGASADTGGTSSADVDSNREASVEVEIGIAYGTEKKRWLQWAVEEWQKTEAGRAIGIELIPMGSLEGAQAILGGDERIHVWSPASALYKDVFVQEWDVQHGGDPIVREEPLALTPMVFVMWKERYDAFLGAYSEVSFETISEALAEPGGWDAIAAQPAWGLFKVGHTHPNQSNSGLATLVLSAYNFHEKSSNLTLEDIVDVEYQAWMRDFESGVSGLANSTGNMMREMVLKGPSSFDLLIVYESVAIDYLENAEGRWGRLQVAYPDLNMWNENPYYILDVPWSSDERRGAADRFLEFLLSEPIQRQSLVHGFRPGDPAVPIRGAESPFTQYQPFGLQVELTTVVDPPRAEVLNNLLASWQRGVGSR